MAESRRLYVRAAIVKWLGSQPRGEWQSVSQHLVGQPVRVDWLTDSDEQELLAKPLTEKECELELETLLQMGWLERCGDLCRKGS